MNLEPVRVLKGILPAEPLRVPGAIAFHGRPLPSLPTPLGTAHFSSGMGACSRILYAQGGLVLALFTRGPEGLLPVNAPWTRAVEDVEAPDGIWVQAAETYIALQRGVPDSGLRAAAEARLMALRAQPGDLAAQAIADDLQRYLNYTGRGPAVPLIRWAWMDSLDAAAAVIMGQTGRNGVGLRCQRGQPALYIDWFGRSGAPQLALLVGGQRFEGEEESPRRLENGVRSIAAAIPFTPALAEAMRTSPASAGVGAAGRDPVTSPPGDVLQKLALRCAILLAPRSGTASAR